MIALIRRSAEQARYPMTGAFVMLWGFQLIVVAQAAEFERSHSFGQLAGLLPSFVQRGLGTKTLILASFKGTMTAGYDHPVACLMLVGLAMYLTTEPAHEIEAGLVDLVLARSVPRHRLLTRSLILAELAIAVAVGLMGVGTWMGLRLFASASFDTPSAGLLALLLLHLAAVATCFAAFGLFVGAWSRRWTTAFTTVMLTAIVMYLVDLLALAWQPMEVLDWISPFRYYHALAILAGDASSWRNLSVLFSAAAVFVAAAYWVFERRDL